MQNKAAIKIGQTESRQHSVFYRPNAYTQMTAHTRVGKNSGEDKLRPSTAAFAWWDGFFPRIYFPCNSDVLSERAHKQEFVLVFFTTDKVKLQKDLMIAFTLKCSKLI